METKEAHVSSTSEEFRNPVTFQMFGRLSHAMCIAHLLAISSPVDRKQYSGKILLINAAGMTFQPSKHMLLGVDLARELQIDIYKLGYWVFPRVASPVWKCRKNNNAIRIN